jgi:hypothetical protein
MNVEEFQRRVDNIVEKIERIPSEMQKEIKKIRKESLPKMMDTSVIERYFREGGATRRQIMTHVHADEGGLYGKWSAKTGYNVQISTENQYITNYGINQKPGDTTTLIDYLESSIENITVKARDCSRLRYGSEQNYD